MIRLLEGGYEPARSTVLSRIARVLNEKSPGGEPEALPKIASDGGEDAHTG